MSISRQTLSIVIVSFKSDHVIHDCIQSISDQIKIVIVDNSNDENFFMYLENDDLCKRLIDHNENIYVVPKSKIKHLGAKAVDNEFEHEVELSRNWHWIWSKFYYNKKHFGFFVAFINGFPIFLKALFKFLFYLILNKNKKNKFIYKEF